MIFEGQSIIPACILLRSVVFNTACLKWQKQQCVLHVDHTAAWTWKVP